MDEFISKSKLYNRISVLEDNARQRYLHTPDSVTAKAKYLEQLNERTALKHLVQDFKTEDARPVVRGAVTHIAEDDPCCWYGYCSVCGSYIPAWNYCPNCGADMRGE